MADWKKNSLHPLDITGYTAEGMGVGRLEGRVVFVPYTIVGERWLVRLEKVNKPILKTVPRVGFRLMPMP